MRLLFSWFQVKDAFEFHMPFPPSFFSFIHGESPEQPLIFRGNIRSHASPGISSARTLVNANVGLVFYTIE